MRVEPVPARAGEEIELHFPEQTDRGIAYVLEEVVGNGWELRYYLSAAADGYTGSPWWTSVDEPQVPWDDVGISGPGPDIVPFPNRQNQASTGCARRTPQMTTSALSSPSSNDRR